MVRADPFDWTHTSLLRTPASDWWESDQEASTTMHEELTTYRERALAKLRSALRRPADGTAWLDVFVNHERPLVRKGNEAASTHIAGAAPDRFLEHVRQRRSCGL